MTDEILQEDSQSSEESSTTKPGDVPYDRFAEVNRERRELEQKVEELQKSNEQSPNPSQADVDKEAQAREYLRNLVREENEAAKLAEKEATVAEQKKFEQDVEDVLSVHTSVDKDEFVKFIEDESEEFGITSVDGAMKLYLKFNQLSEEKAEEGKKEVLAKPKLPRSEGVRAEAPADDSHKSLRELANEITTGLSDK